MCWAEPSVHLSSQLTNLLYFLSTKQRAGRAGRVQPGVCLKLYSSRTEIATMKSVNEPEIRRIPLEEVCLTVLAAGFAKSCSDFLSQTPQPPSDDSVRAALTILQGIGAVVSRNFTDGTRESSSTESLTGLGRHLAKYVRLSVSFI